MEVSLFLDKLIKNNAEYRLLPEDKKIIQFEGIERLIFNKLKSSKYRATAIPEDLEAKVAGKISLSVNHRAPIYVALPTGGIKNPYLVTAPGIDWSEVFNIAYIREYLAPIAKAYKYGVVLDYVSIALLEGRVNRIPQKDIDFYDKEFAALIKFYQDWLPSNFELRYTRISDLIPQKEAVRRIDIEVKKKRKDWDKQSKEVIERKLFRAKRNCLYDPNSKDADSILLDSALAHDAFSSECWLYETAPWDKKYMITLGHNYTTNWAIHVRSAPGSSVNYWCGVGVLEGAGEKYLPTILSNSQYLARSPEINKVKVPMFGEIYSNLREIPLLIHAQ